jgi:hypothetical protein
MNLWDEIEPESELMTPIMIFEPRLNPKIHVELGVWFEGFPVKSSGSNSFP